MSFKHASLLSRRILKPTNLPNRLSFVRCSTSPSNLKLHTILSKVNDFCETLAKLFAKQCNAIAAQRVLRSLQLINLYDNMGCSNYIKRFLANITERQANKSFSKYGLLFGASVLFNWDSEKITDEEIESCASEMAMFKKIESSNSKDIGILEKITNHRWESVIKKEKIQVYRRSLDDSYLYEYKVCGSFYDVPARAFFSVQADLDYRKEWDKLVVNLDSIDRNSDGSEVVHWVMHYPYPMYSRDYLYIRKSVIDPCRKLMVIVSRATEHPNRPPTEDYVRVTTYRSQMCIKPHTEFDENGFDYVLTYYDDPKGNFPTAAYSWMASTGVPDFVEKLHKAAIAYQHRYLNSNTDRSKRRKTAIIYWGENSQKDHQKLAM